MSAKLEWRRKQKEEREQEAIRQVYKALRSWLESWRKREAAERAAQIGKEKK